MALIPTIITELLFCFVFVLFVFGEPAHQERSAIVREETVMSVILDDSLAYNDYVHIARPDKTLVQGAVLHVDYFCSSPMVVGVEVRVWTDVSDDVAVFTRTWPCAAASRALRHHVRVTLPTDVAFRPGPLAPHAARVRVAVLRGWMLGRRRWRQCARSGTCYGRSTAKTLHTLRVPPPYERPEATLRGCAGFPLSIQLLLPYAPQCEPQPVVIDVVSFPVALSGHQSGVHTLPPEYTDRSLRLENGLKHIRFTISLWIFILEYCPMADYHFCSIMHRLTWDDLYLTPLLFINRDGVLHTQVMTEYGTPTAFLSTFSMPRLQWCRLVLTFHDSKWNITMNCEDSWQHSQLTQYWLPPGVSLEYDDRAGQTVFGGSELCPSFKGYIGKGSIHRRRVLDPDSMDKPSADDPMYQLRIREQHQRCEAFKAWLIAHIRECRSIWMHRQEKWGCSNRIENILRFQRVKLAQQCSALSSKSQRHRRHVAALVYRWVLRGRQPDLMDIGKKLHQTAGNRLETSGLRVVKRIVHRLKQASCLGFHDSTHLLSVIYGHGIGVKANDIQAYSYLMRGALDNDHMCQLSLGNKHTLGLDGLPLQHEQAYVYYKNAAEGTKRDRELHRETDVYPETVRLTDKRMLGEQTSEDGELFQWFKHQASRGVVSAQTQLARLLYWGSQGVRRDPRAAAEFYRMSAESDDPVALYDYGLVMLMGIGVPRNVTEGLKWISKSAKRGSHEAINTLGWHALTMEGNMSKAAGLFEASYRLGNKEAAHSLGHMYMDGRMPGRAPDRVKALPYFLYAAARQHQASGILVAMFTIRGHPNLQRDPQNAVEWARYISEQNPALAKVLSKGVRAYIDHKWATALLHYMLAADAGIEIARFNLAYLCDENKEGMVAHIEKECVWRYFNLSTIGHVDRVDPYAWIKMGDYFWYGSENKRNPERAAMMYANAAQRGDPHAIFNLAYLVQEGEMIPDGVWDALSIPLHSRSNNISLLIELYSRCRDSMQTEAHMACTLALYRVYAVDLWQRYYSILTLSSALGLVVGVVLTSLHFYTQLRDAHRVDNV